MENKGSNISEFKVGDIIARVGLIESHPLKYLGISDNKMRFQYLEWPDTLLGEEFSVELGKYGYEDGWEKYTKPIKSEEEIKAKVRSDCEEEMQKYRNREHERMIDELNAIYDAGNRKKDTGLENISLN